MRILHLSDIHFWQYAFNPLRLMSKRMVGMTALLAGRAGRFHLAGVSRLVEHVRRLEADHILITGDLTTTALPDEFRAARSALSGWLDDPARVTIIPGNHDRYTWWAHRSRRFEHYFGEFAPQLAYPWLRWLDPATAILGLDPTRSGITARGEIPRPQADEARRLIAEAGGRLERLIIACHYPVAVPAEFDRDLARKPMINAHEVQGWLRTVGPHLYCCGHIHAAWSYRPTEVPDQLCINPGPPLVPRHFGHNHPGFNEIRLDGSAVTVDHHGWTGESWEITRLHQEIAFFD
ncbi:MAG: metallophosphoesterase family protein [Isosphaeraceae bacterium]